MDQTARQVENQILEERAKLERNLHTLERKARSTMNWRDQFDAHPEAALAIAVGAGVLLSRFLGGNWRRDNSGRAQ